MIIGIYGYKKTGKTTLIEDIIKGLPEYKIATVKHMQHDVPLDQEGTDTYRHRKAGAYCVVGCTPNNSAFIFDAGLKLDEVLKKLEILDDFNVILVEGFKSSDTIKKIAVGDIEETKNTVLRYDDNLLDILEFIRRSIAIEDIYRRLPKLNCGKCGYNCETMAELIHNGEKAFEDCSTISDRGVYLEVDGQEVVMGHFVAEIIENTVLGMVSTLKGVDGPAEVKITISKNTNKDTTGCV